MVGLVLYNGGKIILVQMYRKRQGSCSGENGQCSNNSKFLKFQISNIGSSQDCVPVRLPLASLSQSSRMTLRVRLSNAAG